jgi:hypothetical protein
MARVGRSRYRQAALGCEDSNRQIGSIPDTWTLRRQAHSQREAEGEGDGYKRLDANNFFNFLLSQAMNCRR